MALPIGLKVLNYVIPVTIPLRYRKHAFKAFILTATFIAYTLFHLSRRPLSIVKNVLNRNCSDPDVIHEDDIISDPSTTTWCDWKPFDGPDANEMLGLLDTCYLASYAVFMFFAGYAAERCHLRYFVALAMILSGFCTYLFGLAYYYDIHAFYYFVLIQIITGVFQSAGWPAIFACVANWFGTDSSRGFIFGLWNSHANVGNIVGAAVAGYYLQYNWGLSFIVPGIMIAVGGFAGFLFLTPYPEEVGLSSIESGEHKRDDENTLPRQASTSSDTESDDELLNNPISFMGALRIPGVIEFSACLFFSKLVNYTFLYWLPRYIEQEMGSSAVASAYLSTPFDIGGIIGAVTAGIVSDRTGASGITCIVMLFFTIPSLLAYELYGKLSNIWNIALQFICGLLLNGPYALITTAVAADLSQRVENARALATVTAIVDGTGSIGAAIGPYIAGLISSNSAWANVFYMAMGADFLAFLLLLRIGKHEWQKLRLRSFRRAVV